MLQKKLLTLLIALLSFVVLAMDGFLDFGLLFMSPSHFSALLYALVFFVGALDLPGIMIAFWRPVVGAGVVACGIAGLCFCEARLFVDMKQFPSNKTTAQIICFIAIKMFLVWLLILKSRLDRARQCAWY